MNNNNDDNKEQTNEQEIINQTKMKTTESDILLDQDEVQLKVFPNKKSNGFTVKVLTYNKRYNEQFDLPSDATLFNFLHKWEWAHGVDVGKSGSRIIPDGSTKNWQKLITNNINSDTPLKQLVNQNIEWYSFSPGYENNKINQIHVFDPKLTRQHFKQANEKREKAMKDAVENRKKYRGDKYDPNDGWQPWIGKLQYHITPYPMYSVVDLSKLFTGDKNECAMLKWCIQNRGWVIVEFPNNYRNDIVSCSDIIGKNLKKYMKYMNSNDEKQKESADSEWKTICDNFGFTNFKDYKSVLRVYTNNMLELFKNEYPKEIIDSNIKISKIMDEIALNIIKCSNNMWSSSDDNKMDELCLNDNGFGMIDYVLYNNDINNEQKCNGKGDKGDMLTRNMNVDGHIDPGLFSISFYQFNEGLQLLDRYPAKNNEKEWIRMPEYTQGKYGVLWSGEYSFKLDNDKASGIHRVDYNKNKPRLTGWYEACVKAQIPNKVFQTVDQMQQ